MRKITHLVKVGKVNIGGNSPIVVQSMTDTDTADIKKTVSQIEELYNSGSELIRVTVNNAESAKSIKTIKSILMDKNIDVPIVGDFHFIGHKLLRDYPECAEQLDKYRINPGNLGTGNRKDDNFKTFIEIAKDLDKPVRIGVNAGSLEKDILEKYKEPCPEALVESALRNIKILEDEDFFNLKISVKSSDIFLIFGTCMTDLY